MATGGKKITILFGVAIILPFLTYQIAHLFMTDTAALAQFSSGTLAVLPFLNDAMDKKSIRKRSTAHDELDRAIAVSRANIWFMPLVYGLFIFGILSIVGFFVGFGLGMTAGPLLQAYGLTAHFVTFMIAPMIINTLVVCFVVGRQMVLRAVKASLVTVFLSVLVYALLETILTAIALPYLGRLGMPDMGLKALAVSTPRDIFVSILAKTAFAGIAATLGFLSALPGRRERRVFYLLRMMSADSRKSAIDLIYTEIGHR